MDEWLQKLERSMERQLLSADAAQFPEADPRPRRRSLRLRDGIKDDIASPTSAAAAAARLGQPTLKRTWSYEVAKARGTDVETFKQMMSTTDQIQEPTALRVFFTDVQQKARLVADNLYFNVFFAFVIMSNSVFLGMQLEWSALRVDRFVEPGFIVAHLMYAVLFTGEMFIRITAAGPKTYFVGNGWAWNWLDVFVVVPAWVELALDLSERNDGAEGGAASNFRIIRVFKVTRLLQVVRSLRIVRFVAALRALVLSVVDTTRQLVWALILLLLVIYSFGILFTDAALEYLFAGASEGEDTTDLMKYFGTVFSSCSTLFRSILGGTDWDSAVDALVPVGMAWVLLFHIYIAFCGFAVLNVMTGVFVNSAIKTREKDHETLMQNGVRLKDLVAKLWSKIDATGLGQITISEFETMFEDEAMQAFFEAIEIKAVDAWTLFDSLDVDGDHTISMDEFSERCLQLHGAARSVDLYALKKQMKNLQGAQQQLAEQSARILRALALRLHIDDHFSC